MIDSKIVLTDDRVVFCLGELTLFDEEVREWSSDVGLSTSIVSVRKVTEIHIESESESESESENRSRNRSHQDETNRVPSESRKSHKSPQLHPNSPRRKVLQALENQPHRYHGIIGHEVTPG